tara:strand:+ start:985 stop:1239 length:255 start_codon:yes stop_codon:yes gene_type:complete
MRGITIETLGDHLDHGHTISAHCGDRACYHSAELSLEHLIERLGRDHSALATHLVPHLRCGKCGGKGVSLTVSATGRYSGWKAR